jgi:hypothetical protein
MIPDASALRKHAAMAPWSYVLSFGVPFELLAAIVTPPPTPSTPSGERGLGVRGYINPE